MLCTRPLNIEFGKRVPCGRCIACRINRGQEWSTRILHELDYVRKGSFLTLTYDDEFLPGKGTLVKAHLQGFIKRMRNYNEFKYYGVGEYGDRSNRPHYHIIIIGDDSNYMDYWSFGFGYRGSVTWDSINYVTSYIQKKLYGDSAKKNYGERLAPFAIMSKGMGLRWIKESYNAEQVMLHLGIRRHGKVVRAPRYYMKKLGDEIPNEVWNERARIMSESLDAMKLDPLSISEKDRSSRRQKEADISWKANESPKGSF